jgi:hypothetical protein
MVLSFSFTNLCFFNLLQHYRLCGSIVWLGFYM